MCTSMSLCTYLPFWPAMTPLPPKNGSLSALTATTHLGRAVVTSDLHSTQRGARKVGGDALHALHGWRLIAFKQSRHTEDHRQIKKTRKHQGACSVLQTLLIWVEYTPMTREDSPSGKRHAESSQYGISKYADKIPILPLISG
jgi:hypothetical protein